MNLGIAVDLQICYSRKFLKQNCLVESFVIGIATCFTLSSFSDVFGVPNICYPNYYIMALLFIEYNLNKFHLYSVNSLQVK